MIIALSGYAGSGKDTVGDILVADYGFTKVAFADPLRRMAEELNPIITHLHGSEYRYVQALADYGYTKAKQRFPEVRSFLQRLGTEAGRGVLGENVWVDATMKRIAERRADNWVIADCRFPNEAIATAEGGGIVVRINRPGVSMANTHVSETALNAWAFDDIIQNSSTIDDLRHEVDLLTKRWL